MMMYTTKRIRPSAAVGKVLASGQKWKCGHCDKLLEAAYHIDHRVPLCYGGSNAIENLWVLCANCHACKTLAEQQSFSVGGYGKFLKRSSQTQECVSLINTPFYKRFDKPNPTTAYEEAPVDGKTLPVSIETKESCNDTLVIPRSNILIGIPMKLFSN